MVIAIDEVGPIGSIDAVVAGAAVEVIAVVAPHQPRPQDGVVATQPLGHALDDGLITSILQVKRIELEVDGVVAGPPVTMMVSMAVSVYEQQNGAPASVAPQMQ